MAGWLQSLPQQTGDLWPLAVRPSVETDSGDHTKGTEAPVSWSLLVHLGYSKRGKTGLSGWLPFLGHEARFSTRTVITQSTRRGQASCMAGCSPVNFHKPLPNSASSHHKDNLPRSSWKTPFLLGSCIQNLPPLLCGCVRPYICDNAIPHFFAVLSSTKMATGDLYWLFFNILGR